MARTATSEFNVGWPNIPVSYCTSFRQAPVGSTWWNDGLPNSTRKQFGGGPFAAWKICKKPLPISCPLGTPLPRPLCGRPALKKSLRNLNAAAADWKKSNQIAPSRAAENLRSEEHTSELQSQSNLVCRLLLE